MSKSTIKANKVVIWRDEVNRSEIHCACSQPSIKSPLSASNSTVDSDDWPGGRLQKSSSAISGIRTLRHARSDLESIPSRTSGPYSVSAKTRSTTTKSQPKDGSVICSTCDTPIDTDALNAQLKSQRDDEFTGHRAGRMTEVNITLGTSSPTSYIAGMIKSVKRRVSKAEGALNPDDKLNGAPQDETSTGKRISKLFKGKKKPSTDGADRSLATKMYCGDESNASSASELAGIEWSASDQYKRPKPAIDDSVARLHRARRLLNKTNT